MAGIAAVIRHLHYPDYLMTIIGVGTRSPESLSRPALPENQRVAYAGLVINYTGALASHMTVGDPAGVFVAPVLFTAFAMTSWALRSPARRLAGSPL